MRLYWIIPTYLMVLLAFAFYTTKAFSADPVYEIDVDATGHFNCGPSPVIRGFTGKYTIISLSDGKMKAVALSNNSEHLGRFVGTDGFATEMSVKTNGFTITYTMIKIGHSANAVISFKHEKSPAPPCSVTFSGVWKKSTGI